LEIANYHLWRDAEKLWREALGVARPWGKDTETYRAALAKAQQANIWDPNNPGTLGILGVAQYRVGLYEEALRTFQRDAELKANEGRDVRGTVTSAFTAMALYQLGRVDEAKSALEELRALHKEDERIAKGEVPKALLAEAEGLIEGKKP